ncbi:hypothetical protein L0244_15575, partial [bacterium]|nr:hypothetical protein [bacterium]
RGVVGMGGPDHPVNDILSGEGQEGPWIAPDVKDEDIVRDEKSGEKLYARVPHRIDSKMIRSGIRPMTEAMCKLCRQDFAPFYSSLPEIGKIKVKAVVAKHIEDVHMSGDRATIIPESQLPKNYLNVDLKDKS